MLKSLEDISMTKKRLKVEIPAEAIEEEIKRSLEDIKQKIKLPGFRPGKVPMGMIEKKFEKSVEAEAIEKIVPRFYMDAVREASITPVSQPVFEEKIDFKRNNPLNLLLTVEVLPKIENLDIENLKVREIPLEVTDEEIESTLKRLQEQNATYEILDKSIEPGDLITADYEITTEGKISSGKDQLLKVDPQNIPREMADGLINKKAGDTVEVETSFPEDYHVKALAGKTAKIKNVIKQVKRKNHAPLDDEFAKDMGSETFVQLKDKIKEEIIKLKEEQAVTRQKDELLKRLVETHEFEVPESMLESELYAMVQEHKRAMKMDAADTGRDEELRAELKPEAMRVAKASILLDVIGEREKVSLTDEELKEKISSIAHKLSMSPEGFMKMYVQRDGSLDGLKKTLHDQKVLDRLLSRAAREKGE